MPKIKMDYRNAMTIGTAGESVISRTEETDSPDGCDDSSTMAAWIEGRAFVRCAAVWEIAGGPATRVKRTSLLFPQPHEATPEIGDCLLPDEGKSVDAILAAESEGGSGRCRNHRDQKRHEENGGVSSPGAGHSVPL
jgi:hypothetical protein